MAEKSLNTRIQNKCDTTANWAKATNFVPKKGEIIVYSDGGGTGIPKMKVGDGITKVGSLKFADEGQYLPLAGGTLTGALGMGENMSITEVDTSTKHSLVFYPTAVGPNDGHKRVAFVYDPTSGELRAIAPKFQGQFIGTASQASKVTNALTINGTSYNGSAAVDLTIGGGATITLKTWTDADVA